MEVEMKNNTNLDSDQCLCLISGFALSFCLFLLQSKLQTDIRTTNAEEMRISLETCYEEVCLCSS